MIILQRWWSWWSMSSGLKSSSCGTQLQVAISQLMRARLPRWWSLFPSTKAPLVCTPRLKYPHSIPWNRHQTSLEPPSSPHSHMFPIYFSLEIFPYILNIQRKTIDLLWKPNLEHSQENPSICWENPIFSRFFPYPLLIQHSHWKYNL